MSALHLPRPCRRLTTAGILVILVGLLTAPGAIAQQADGAARDSSIAPGERVRITTYASSEPTVGWVDAAEPDEIRLVDESGHSIDSISREDVRRIERSRVRRSLWDQAAPGAIAGGALGFVIGIVTTEEKSCEPNSSLCFDYPDKGLAGIGGFAIGMIGGGLISAAISPSESWEDSYLPRLTAGAGASGAFLALQIPLSSGS